MVFAKGWLTQQDSPQPMKTATATEARYRSLLQKAVRRGNTELVYTASAWMQARGQKQRNWYRMRAAVITFEECWPLGAQLGFNPRFHSKVAALVRVCRAVKAKDATGLGCLAQALSLGDRSVLDGGTDDRHLKIVAQAIRRPDAFWSWAKSRPVSPAGKALIDSAFRFRRTGRPQDSAVILAAAYLATAGKLPPVTAESAHKPDPFPYWAALDRHTAEGKRVLNDIARDLHIPPDQLEWCCFFFAGAATNELGPSPWWSRHLDWRFRKIGLPAAEAHLLWEPVKAQVKEALAEEARLLHRELYSWKLAHQSRVDTLKTQVELFIRNYNQLTGSQLKLM